MLLHLCYIGQSRQSRRMEQQTAMPTLLKSASFRMKLEYGVFSNHTCNLNCCVSQSVLVALLCLFLCNPKDCSPPGSSVHEILQARILEWGAISFSRGSSQSSGWTWVSHIAGRFFTVWTTREASTVVWLTIIGNVFSVYSPCLY